MRLGLGKLNLSFRTCPHCNKIIKPFQKYYTNYIEWTTKEPWAYTVFHKTQLCQKCYKEYCEYYQKKYQNC